MSVSMQPISELTSRGEHVLIQELGVVDAMRFLSQFRQGSGDYTAERDQLFDDVSVKTIAADIKARRNGVPE